MGNPSTGWWCFGLGKRIEKGKREKGKGKRKKSASIAHWSSPSSKKCKTQKVPRLYHTEKHQLLPETVPGPQPRNVLAYSDLRNPKDCQQSDAGDGFGRLCSPRLRGKKVKTSSPLKAIIIKGKKLQKRQKLCLKAEAHGNKRMG